MPIEISLKKSTANPTSASGLTLAEPVFNHSNNTLWIGKGSGNSPVWVGAGVCGASGGIAAGLTTQLPTHAAVKNYFDAVSSSFLGTTASYVSTFNGRTGAVQGVSSAAAGTGISISAATGAITITNIGVQSFNGLTGAVTGVTVGGANTFTALQTFNSGISASNLVVSGGVTLGPLLWDNETFTPLNPVTIDSAHVEIGDVNGELEGLKLVIDNLSPAFNLYGNVTQQTGNFTSYASIQGQDIIGNSSVSTSTVYSNSYNTSNNLPLITFTTNGLEDYGNLAIGSTGITTSIAASLVVNGNLTVSGGITSTFSETVLIEDNIITLNSNVTGTPTENAGIEIERGTSANTQILWNESTDKWTFTNNGTLYYDIPTDYVSSFNGLTGAVGGVTTSAANTFTALNSFNAGISAAGATLSGTVTAPTPAIGTNNTQVATTAFVQNEIVADTVTTFNGRTGAVQGVSAAVAGSYITVSAATGAVTITNTGVQTFNGLTGAVTFTDYVTSFNGVTGAVGGVTTSVANTFTALQSFNSGISAAGATLSANTRIPAGATLTVDGNIVANGNVSLGNATSDTITSAADITVNSLTVGRGGGGVSSNTAVGLSALVSNSTGSFNTAIGNAALTANTTGASNVAVGDGALNANTTGSLNTAFGRRALLVNNGSSNTAAGNGALSALSAGSFNTAIGRLTGNGVITATGGIYIGYSNIGTDLSTNEIVIGTQTTGFGSNTAVIGATTQTAAYIYGLVNAMGGVSAAGATLNGTVTAPTPAIGTNNTQVATTAFVQNEIVADTVTTFNGRTGAVQGVSSAAAGTGISISAATGAVTITNTGVQTFNGLTGAVGGVTTSAANTFTALNSFNAGISAAGITVGSKLFLGEDPSGLAQIKTLPDNSFGGLYVYMPFGRIGDINNNWGNGIQIGVFADEGRILMGDVDGAANNTTVEINDNNGTITLSGAVSASSSVSSGTLTSTGSVKFGGASAFVDSQTTTLGTTAANQNIGSVEINDGAVDTNRSVEFFVQASHSSGYETLKIMVIHDGTNTYNTQYGLIRTGASLCSSYTTTITGATSKILRLRATPTNTNTTFKVVQTVIPA